MKTPIEIKPQAIEAKSFAIIAEEFYRQTGKKTTDFPPEQFAIIQRVIHATGDFSFAENMVFHPKAVQTAIAYLRAGRDIVTDVNMAATGINKTALSKWGGEVSCRVAEPEIAKIASREQATRSETAIRIAMGENPGIIAIGNAPTALLRAIDLLKYRRDTSCVVIGVPVGFVNAAESKAILADQSFPFITALGRKGGSPVAAAIVNALIKLAAEEER